MGHGQALFGISQHSSLSAGGILLIFPSQIQYYRAHMTPGSPQSYIASPQCLTRPLVPSVQWNCAFDIQFSQYPVSQYLVSQCPVFSHHPVSQYSVQSVSVQPVSGSSYSAQPVSGISVSGISVFGSVSIWVLKVSYLRIRISQYPVSYVVNLCNSNKGGAVSPRR